jgi:dynein heavy chain 2
LILLNTKDGTLEVNYSDRLLLLIREVRQLMELGYKKDVDAGILKTVELGQKYSKEAITLKGIAQFYNRMPA